MSFPHFDLLWIHRGKIKIKMKNYGYVPLKSGQGILLFPNTYFVGSSYTSKTIASIHHFRILDKPNLEWPLNYLATRQNGRRLVLHPNQSLELCLHRSLELSKENYSGREQTLQAYLMMSILSEIFLISDDEKNRNKNRHVFKSLTQSLLNNLSHPWTIQEMAEFCQMPESSFRLKFKKEMKESPIKYFIKLKMTEAAKLLRETSISITNISQKVGFEHEHHFYKTFKIHFNVTPSIFRKTSIR